MTKEEGNVASWRGGNRKVLVAKSFVIDRADAQHLRLHVEVEGLGEEFGDVVGGIDDVGDFGGVLC